MVLLIEADGALGSEDLIGVPHLPPGRDAADEQRTHGAAIEATNQLRLVVVGHRLVAFGRRQDRMHRLDLGHQRGDWADKRQAGVDDMRGEVAHISVGATARSPTCW